MISSGFRLLGIAAALAGTIVPAHAQQLITRLTGPECTARGGSIRTWTSTAGLYPQRGECYVPPRVRGGGGGGVAGGGGGNGTAAALGAAAGVLGGVAGLLGALQEMEDARAERERLWLEGLRDDRDQMRAGTLALEQSLVQREAALRERERLGPQQDAPMSADARAAAANPFAAAPAPPAAGFRSDEQIRTECEQSANAGLCELALRDARAREPAYREWKAADEARLDENVRRSKAEVDRLNGDPDLAKCREGEKAPWTIAGCYDLRAGSQQAGANPNALRDQLRRSLGDADVGGTAGQEPDARRAPGPAPTAAPTPGEPLSTLAAGTWPQTPWRTRDEQACRKAGGVLVGPAGTGDLAGIPQVVLDNPEVPRAQLESTPYCRPVPNMSPADNAAAVRAMTTPP